MTEHHDLHEDLEAYVAGIDVPPGDIDDVRRRGTRRRRATLIGGGAGALMLLAALALVVSPAFDRPVPDIVDVAEDPSPGPSPSSSPTASPSPAASPADGIGPDEALDPMSELEAPARSEGPTVLVATDDGIVRWQDGETTPVDGLAGPVDIALPGPDGAVYFQRNDEAFGRLADGTVTTVAVVDEFDPRMFETSDSPLTPVGMRLWDSDPVSGRVVFTVTYTGPSDRAGAIPPTHDVLWEAARDGTLTDLAEWWSWESGATAISIGSDRTARNVSGELGQGSIRTHSTKTGWEPLTFLRYHGEMPPDDSEQPYQVRGAELSADAGALAVVERAAPATATPVLVVVDLGPDHREAHRIPLEGTGSTPWTSEVWAFVGDHILLGGDGPTLLVDLAAGTVTDSGFPPGRAALVHEQAQDR